MHILDFSYELKINFKEAVRKHQFVYRCIPKCEPRQEITNLQIEISPCDYWAFGHDGFGNKTVYGSMQEEHNEFSLHVFGHAQTDWKIYDGDKLYNQLFLIQTPLTKPGISMLCYLDKIFPHIRRKTGNYGKACEIMDGIYDYFSYAKGTTGVATTAEQAFSQKMGVCQDYAHIMIGLCRQIKIPARYVSGAMIGEGCSHAWVEIFSDGCWYGFDPTNHILVNDLYVVFARGRDSSDCIINKGTYWGIGYEQQKIKVLVEEIK